MRNVGYKKPDNRAYESEASQTLGTICYTWEKKWLSLKEKYGERIYAYDKGLAKTALLMMIRKHCDLQRDANQDNAIEYLKGIIFHEPAPSSVGNATLITDKEYYSLLAEKLNTFEKEREDENNNDHYSWRPNSPQAPPPVKKSSLRFTGGDQRGHFLDD